MPAPPRARRRVRCPHYARVTLCLDTRRLLELTNAIAPVAERLTHRAGKGVTLELREFLPPIDPAPGPSGRPEQQPARRILRDDELGISKIPYVAGLRACPVREDVPYGQRIKRDGNDIAGAAGRTLCGRCADLSIRSTAYVRSVDVHR